MTETLDDVPRKKLIEQSGEQQAAVELEHARGGGGSGHVP
jgi:hypothetical protein